jgi:hypothetical protein
MSFDQHYLIVSLYIKSSVISLDLFWEKVFSYILQVEHKMGNAVAQRWSERKISES